MIKRRISNAKNKSDIPASSTVHNLIFPVEMATSWGKLLWENTSWFLLKSTRGTTFIDYDIHACSPRPPWGCTSHGSSVQSWAEPVHPAIWPRFELKLGPVLDSITKQEPFKLCSPSVYGRSTWGTLGCTFCHLFEWILTDKHLGLSGNNAQNIASLIKGKMIDEPEKSGVPCFQTNLDLRLLKDLPASC